MRVVTIQSSVQPFLTKQMSNENADSSLKTKLCRNNALIEEDAQSRGVLTYTIVVLRRDPTYHTTFPAKNNKTSNSVLYSR